MTKKREPAAAKRPDRPAMGQFRRQVRRNTGGSRVNPAPDELKKEMDADE
jgi:hypothetical protein